MHIYRFLILLLTLSTLPEWAYAEQTRLQGSVGAGSANCGNIAVGAIDLGSRDCATKKLTLKPDAITGDGSRLSVFCDVTAPAGSLSRECAVPQPQRLRVGGASPDIGRDWLNTIIPFTTNIAQLPVLSNTGAYAVLGASRTIDLPSSGNQGTIGIGGFVINDNKIFSNTAYASYFEARRAPGTGTTQGIETNIVNQGNIVSFNPYSSLSIAGITSGYWASSGRSDVGGSTDSSAAFGIVNNGAAFKRGIVFAKNAISGATGTSGLGEAISMGQGHQLAWYAANGTPAAYIWSGVTGSGQTGQRLVFSDIGPQFQNANGRPVFSVGTSASAVNGLTLMPGAAGSPPIMGASGDDSNIALALRSKGNFSPIFFQSGGGATALQVNPVVSGVNYAVVAGAAAGVAPAIQVQGSDNDISLSLAGKNAGLIKLGSIVTLKVQAVADLPICSAATQDSLAAVSDAVSPTYRGALTGGGTVRTMVYCDGVSWTAH